jgi:hypothetical protein
MMSTMVRAPPQPGIAAIALAEADGPSDMLLQFKHRVASAVRRFPWKEKNSHVHRPGLMDAKLEASEHV